jgi:hypothetical protein
LYDFNDEGIDYPDDYRKKFDKTEDTSTSESNSDSDLPIKNKKSLKNKNSKLQADFLFTTDDNDITEEYE